MNFFIYGLIFIGVGIVQMWRDVKRKGPHVHRCAKCGTEWAHAIADEHCNWPSIAAAAAAHTCPKCGAERFEIERLEKGAQRAPASGSSTPPVGGVPGVARKSVSAEPVVPSAGAPADGSKPSGGTTS